MSPAQQLAIQQDWRNGYSADQIARRYGVTVRTVLRMVGCVVRERKDLRITADAQERYVRRMEMESLVRDRPEGRTIDEHMRIVESNLPWL